ncbi:MAG: urease accessory protein UreE [Casimicrobiaceae bacterium]
MLRIERVLPGSTAPSNGDATLTLPFELRRRSRLLVRLDDGEEAGLFLPRGTVLRDGDLLEATGDRVVRVIAADEDVYEVRPSGRCSLAQAAYHLGNRHVQVELGVDALKIARDPVLRDMLDQLGATLDEKRAPFHPEPGAYGGGHRHEGDADHEEEHALARSTFVLHHGPRR